MGRRIPLAVALTRKLRREIVGWLMSDLQKSGQILQEIELMTFISGPDCDDSIARENGTTLPDSRKFQ